MELIRTWKKYDYKLELFDPFIFDDRPQHRLAYKFYFKDKLIFEGNDYGCSILHAIDSDASVAGLLGFISLRPGDTDQEYFDDYTPEQLEFAEQEGEELSLIVFEMENPDEVQD